MNTPVREGETIEGSRTMRNRPYPVLKCSSRHCSVGAAGGALHPILLSATHVADEGINIVVMRELLTHLDVAQRDKKHLRAVKHGRHIRHMSVGVSAVGEAAEPEPREKRFVGPPAARGHCGSHLFANVIRVDGVSDHQPGRLRWRAALPHKQFDVRSQHLSIRQPRQRRGELRLREDLTLLLHDAAQLVRSQPVRAFPA